MSLPARVRLAGEKWWDVMVPDDALGASELRLTQIAVQAWWKVTSNYDGEWRPRSRAEPADCKWSDGNVFTCLIDGGATVVGLDLSKAGGPW